MTQVLTIPKGLRPTAQGSSATLGNGAQPKSTLKGLRQSSIPQILLVPFDAVLGQ